MTENSLHLFAKIASDFLVREKIRTIVEVGARDCQETLGLNEKFPEAVIYSFECNPGTLAKCRAAVKNIRNIHLVEKAVSDTNGTIKFYPIDQEQTKTTWIDGNPGASSIFKASGKYTIETYVQKEIEVESITLQSFMKDHQLDTIDMLWMDIQGAEIMALKGLSMKIHDVKIIHTEVNFLEIYSGQPLFEDIYSFLKQHNFFLIKFTTFGKYAGDAVFLNKQEVKNSFSLIKLKLLDKLLKLQHFFLQKIVSRLR
jgi:FkbM family methyltransferase